MNKTLGPFITIDKTGIEPNKYPHELFDYFSLPAYDSGKSQETVFGREIDSNKFLIKANTILVSKLNPRTKRVWLVTGNFTKRIVASTEFIPIVCDEGVDTEFLAQSMLQDDIYRVFQANAVGTTNSHVRFPPSLVEKIELFIPAIIEQQKIAKILATVDNLIDQTQKLIDKYTAVKQGIMADLFSRGIDLSGTPETNRNYGQLRPTYKEAPDLYQETELGFIPKDWIKSNLKESCSAIGDGVHYSVKRVSQGVPFLFVSCIKNGEIQWNNAAYISQKTYEEISKNCKPYDGLILFTAVGSYGQVAYVDSNQPFGFERNIAYLKPINSIIKSRYLFYLLDAHMIKNQVESLVMGNAQKLISLGNLGRIIIPIPSENEQKKITEKLDSVGKKIDSEKTLLDKYKSIKKGLTQDLLTGKVKV